jgi:hypothetical protein
MVLKLGTLWEVEQRYFESFEMWCWRNKEKVSWNQSCEQQISITHSEGGKEHFTNTKTKKG